MKLPFTVPLLALAASILVPVNAEPANEKPIALIDTESRQSRRAELDAYWAIVSKAVNTGVGATGNPQ